MDTLNFIDISSWQSDMNLENVLDANPLLDGVIVKATEGTYYVNDLAENWIKILKQLGRPYGFYHFLSKNDSAEEQANFFIDRFRAYFGSGIPFIDYEDEALANGTEWLKVVLDTVYKKTGVKPMVYCSLSVIHSQNFNTIAAAGYGLWMAQYADFHPTGIIDKPWQSGSVKPFDRYIIHQYTSCGYLAEYNGRLDLDKFYGTFDDWAAFAKGESVPDDPAPIKKTVNPEIIKRVLDGKYGIGISRKIALTMDGYDYEEVQGKINEIYTIANKFKMEVAGNEDYADLIYRVAFGG